MTDEQIAKLINDNSKMAYILGVVYGGLLEIASKMNFGELGKLPIPAILELIDKHYNDIFYKTENLTKQNENP